MDIWIDRAHENTAHLVQAIDDFSFGSLGLVEEDILREDQFIQLGYPPNRIDLVTDLPGVIFDECYQSRVDLD